MPKPIVYLAGAGPGDYKLVTVKTFELIKAADCIVYDYLANPQLLEFSRPGCKIIYVGKKGSAHTLPQNKINQLLVSCAKKYKTVLRLKGGDPFIFGRGAEEALYLKKKSIDFEIIPGVTSAIAVPAYAGIPLTERTKNSSVGFITGHEDSTKKESSLNWGALVEGLGTLVFLMGVGNLEVIVKKLIAAGKPKNTPVAVIRWGTTARQKTVTGNLMDIVELCRKNKMTAPAIIVVGEAVGLRRYLNWFEKKPFFGQKIAVTRTRKQASKLSEKLSELGAEVIEIPTIEIASLKKDSELKKAFSEKYDWVIFSSQNGVKEFSDFLERNKADSRIFTLSKVCAIGSETEKALRDIGIRADYVPKEFRAEGILQYFNQKNLVGKKFLILRAKQARGLLPEGLKIRKAIVKVIDLYDTVIPKDSAVRLKRISKDGIDWVTFTSSSTAENFMKLIGKSYRNVLKRVKLASIGPVTSVTLRKFGLKPAAEAKVYTIDGLVEAIKKSNIKTQNSK